MSEYSTCVPQENKLREMQKTVLESKQKAQDWKEYSNMQRFKAELLADMARFPIGR